MRSFEARSVPRVQAVVFKTVRGSMGVRNQSRRPFSLRSLEIRMRSQFIVDVGGAVHYCLTPGSAVHGTLLLRRRGAYPL